MRRKSERTTEFDNTVLPICRSSSWLFKQSAMIENLPKKKGTHRYQRNLRFHSEIRRTDASSRLALFHRESVLRYDAKENNLVWKTIEISHRKKKKKKEAIRRVPNTITAYYRVRKLRNQMNQALINDGLQNDLSTEGRWNDHQMGQSAQAKPWSNRASGIGPTSEMLGKKQYFGLRNRAGTLSCVLNGKRAE